MLWRLTFIFIVDFYLQALVWCVQPRIASQHSTEWRTIVYPIVCSHRTSVCIILKSCEPALYYMAYDCILKAFRGFSILRPNALRHKLHRVTYICTQLLKPSFCAPAPYCLAYDCTPKAGLAWCICSLFSIFVEIIRIFVMVKVAITRWRIFKLLSSLVFCMYKWIATWQLINYIIVPTRTKRIIARYIVYDKMIAGCLVPSREKKHRGVQQP